MKIIGEDIWTHEDSMSLVGNKLELRMTIVKLENGSLWVHSPTTLSAELIEEVNKLGPVGFIVGASNGHNLSLRDWQEEYPDAVLYVSSGIPNKIKLVKFQLLDETFNNIWENDLAHEYMIGIPFFNESVFLHKKTKSLIVTDLIQNHSAEKPSGIKKISKHLFELIGFKGICIAPPLKMGIMIKDKPNFASCIKIVENWDFEKIVVAHGDIIETNAKQVFINLCERFHK